MDMADRLQNLRKAKGLSQEALAQRLDVSRQAVSKWESGQSVPEAEKIVALSDFFGVTTDYLLKGVEPEQDEGRESRALAGRVLYIASTALIAIGLFCAFGGWYEKQTMEAVWGAMAIQAVGAAGYYIARLLSAEKAPFAVDWLNLAGLVFMPLSMTTGWAAVLIFKRGRVAPYPSGPFHTVGFVLAFAVVLLLGYRVLKKRRAARP